MTIPTITERIEGSGTLGQAVGLHARIWSALASGPAVTLDLSGVEEADVSFVQLIASATLTAERTGRQLTMIGLSPRLRVTFEKSGVRFDPALGRIIPD